MVAILNLLIFSRAKLHCCVCLGLMYFSVDLFYDNDVQFVELRTYLQHVPVKKNFLHCTTSSNFEISV